MSYYVGLDLGGTSIKSGVVDHQGHVLFKQSVATPADQGPDVVIDEMASLAFLVVKQAGLEMQQINAVGIGSPGPINFDEGLLAAAPNLPRFKNVPIRDRLAEATGCPTVLENDANAAAFAEYWIGAAGDPSIRDLVALTLGTGIGSGLIVDGHIVHGGFGQGGEAGHMIVVPEGQRCGCGQRGCLEVYTSASYTARRATDALERDSSSVLHDLLRTPGRRVTAKDVFEAAKAGDGLAGRIVDETATSLGMACVNLCRLLDPQMIVFAGGMIQAGPYLLDRIRTAFSVHDWKMSPSRVQIVQARLGYDAGFIGAAAVAWDAYESGRLG